MWQAKAFWEYSISLYQNDDVKQICLQLQDDYSLNVNIVLLCCYLDSQDHNLSQDGFTMLCNAEPALLQKLVKHRTARKSAEGSETYQGMLVDELDMEKQHQAALIKCLCDLPLTSVNEPNLFTYAHSVYLDLPGSLTELLVALVKTVNVKLLDTQPKDNLK